MKSQNVVHLIAGLGKGGAETMLYQIIKYGSSDGQRPVVVSLGLSSYYEEQLLNLGVRIISLDIKHELLQTLQKLCKIGKSAEVLCCWMYLANLLGYFAGRRHVKKLIWCIRHSDLSTANNSRKTLLFSRVCAWLSPKVDLIAYNGCRAREVHISAGYRPRKEVILGNGVDGEEYFRDEKAGKQVKKFLEIGDDCKIILSVAKNTQIKDLPTFIRTLSLIRESEPDVVGIMCGKGVDCSDKKLAEYCKEYGLCIGRDIYLIGFREDIREIMNAADVYVLHSSGEAFPNTLIQAMACETLVAATDVGDVRRILDMNELIVKPGDYRGLAKTVLKLLALEEEKKEVYRARNREKALSKYDIRKIVKSYEVMLDL